MPFVIFKCPSAPHAIRIVYKTTAYNTTQSCSCNCGPASIVVTVKLSVIGSRVAGSTVCPLQLVSRYCTMSVDSRSWYQ